MHAGQLLGRFPERQRPPPHRGRAPRAGSRGAARRARTGAPGRCTARNGRRPRWRRTASGARHLPSTVRAPSRWSAPTLRRTRLEPSAAPLPARLLRVQPGCAATARVGSPGRTEATAELRGEEEVGQLGRAVAHPGVVRRGAGQVVEVEPAHAVQVRAHGDDPRALGRDDPVEQQAGQGEVAEVVRAHLELEAVGRQPVRGAHDPGVVDQDVEPCVRGRARLGGPAHRDQVGQVERQELQGAAVELALQLVAGPARPSPGRGRRGSRARRGRPAPWRSRSRCRCWRP